MDFYENKGQQVINPREVAGRLQWLKVGFHTVLGLLSSYSTDIRLLVKYINHVVSLPSR